MQQNRIFIVVLICLIPAVASAQRTVDRMGVTRSRISDERVNRQTEVGRLESLIESIESRMMRLERQQLQASRLPAITIAEAKATIEFAELRLEESEYAFEHGEASKSQVAGDRLALVRAQGQLESATSAHTESILSLELDVVYAQRLLMEATKEKELNERFAAKGYVSSDALRFLILDHSFAEKRLEIAKLRLSTQRKAAGVTTSMLQPTADLIPQKNSSEQTVVAP